MPGPKTHEIFYKELKKYLPEDMLAGLPHYDEYSIYAQGHDLFLYCDYWKPWKLNENVRESLLLQKYDFQEYVYQFLHQARENSVLHNEQVLLFIGVGYISHHILDSYMHPLIIFYSGDHTRDTTKSTWMHGIIETLLDAYFMEKAEGIDCRKYKVYRDFSFKEGKTDRILYGMLDECLWNIYGIKSGGCKIKTGIEKMKHFMRAFKYDPTGIKKIFFDSIDTVAKGSSSFSYHVNAEEAIPYLNLNHQIWENPGDSEFVSTKSMLDLYEDALHRSAEIADKVYALCKKRDFSRKEVYEVIPDCSSDYGLPQIHNNFHVEE